MKQTSLYTIPIIYMILYIILILLSGIWLFFLSQGLTSDKGVLDTLIHFIDTPAAKSLEGFIEVAAPHMFSISITVFLVSHFMLFSTRISQRNSLLIFIALFLFSLLNIVSYGFIIMGLVVSGWIKVFSLLIFLLLFVSMLWMVAISL